MNEIGHLLSSLHDHLQATEEKPLPAESNRILGEAQSIAADLADQNVDRTTAHERVEEVLELLDELDGTGNEDADDHVEAARRAGERVLKR